jgi:hypothetical protein
VSDELKMWVVVDDQGVITGWSQDWQEAVRVAERQLVDRSGDVFTAGEGSRRVVRMIEAPKP